MISADKPLRILITGATGSFGQAFIKSLFDNDYSIERLVIFSRDELKQWQLQQLYPKDKYPMLRFFLGDIRDRERMISAMKNIDYVVHAAALKQVPAAEYNPMEFVKTNVMGTENVVNAAITCKVSKVIALSTDKAAAPINLYGATKLCADKLVIASNNITGDNPTLFSVVRYGNVMGSRGSVIPFFQEASKSGVIPITDPGMTRFNITLSEGVDLVLWALKHAKGGEIFVPKIPSYNIMDVADAISSQSEKLIVGIRPGEKIHEEMITASDSPNTISIGNLFAILPSTPCTKDLPVYDGIQSTTVDEGFVYNSGTNKEFLSVDQLRQLISNNI